MHLTDISPSRMLADSGAMCHDRGMREFFKFIGHAFRRESGMLAAIGRSLAFVAFAPAVTGFATLVGIETTAWKWWLIPITAFSIPMALLWRAYRYGHNLESAATPRLSIDYEPVSQEYGHIYRADAPIDVMRLCRLRVNNPTPENTGDCSLSIISLLDKDWKPSKHFGESIRQMNDDTRPTFKLNAGTPMFFDFLESNRMDGAHQITLKHPGKAHKLPAANGPFTITLQASGFGPPSKAIFKFWLDEIGMLQLERVNA